MVLIDDRRHYLYLRVVIFFFLDVDSIRIRLDLLYGSAEMNGNGECNGCVSCLIHISYDGLNGTGGYRLAFFFIPAYCDTLWLHTVSGT